jgi:sigma-B regulation protein RsbU (phosphoserine phosphatase)
MDEVKNYVPSILIVDDNPKNLQILGNYLQQEGYKVEFSLDGKSALNWIKKTAFDLVLLDIMMPLMDGFEVCRILKNDPVYKKIPIIFLTAKTDTESIVNGFDVGAVDYVIKPFNQKELIARVKTQIEIKRSRDEISRYLREIENKNKLIYYSIQAAQIIQKAVLKTSENEKDFFDEQFSLFIPKDIVSGDFYWYQKIDDKILAGVFDCTGHGIPGAFMSILGVTLLNETVIMEKITEPHMILTRLREKIIKALGQKGTEWEVKSGMDGSLISYDQKNKSLIFSGAFNPMYLIRNNAIIEFKGDNMPLAYHENISDFSYHEVNTEPGDLIYMFSDGYVDQFGGQNDKKFHRSQFKEVLLKHHEKPLDEQKQMILNTHLNWKGKEDQTDDITVVGLKL